MEILREYEDNGLLIVEYTKDGSTVHATVETSLELINATPSSEMPQVTQSTPEEIQSQILMNTELLVMYKEFGL